VRINVVEHPLARDLLSRLRDESTSLDEFRRAGRALSRFMIYEASRDLFYEKVVIRTPLEDTEEFVNKNAPVGAVILRAGLAMLESFLEIFPKSPIGFFGLERDEEAAIAQPYFEKIPDVRGRIVMLLDPMLATGGSAVYSIKRLKEQKAEKIVFVCLVSAPEGIEVLRTQCSDVVLYTCAIDRELNAQKFILPGLGDFGDRYSGK
jgi:uracil phosphoribosyltransferase